MLFFSALLNSEVKDNSNQTIGNLRDVIVSIQDYPIVRAVVVWDSKKKLEHIVAMDQVELLGKGMVSLKKRENDLYNYTKQVSDILLKDSVLDRQIIDNEGMNMMRVNDIVLGNLHGELSAISIEIGLRGIFRRLGMEQFPLINRLSPQLVPWKGFTLLESGMPQLQTEQTQKHLNRLHPADLANLVEELNAKRGAALVSSLNNEKAAEVLEELDDDLKVALIEQLGLERAGDILEGMSPDQAADILDDLPDEKAQRIIAEMAPKEGQKILELIHYDDREAGGLMTTDYIKVHPERTVAHVREKLRVTVDDIPNVSYIYVVDHEKHPVGVLSMRTLAVANDDTIIEDIMTTNLFTVEAHAKIREVASFLTKYNLFSIAVVDNSNRLLGIVMVDDVMRQLFPEA